MSDLRFEPPPIPGYVFFSNYCASDEKGELSPERIEVELQERYNIPRADVCVVPFAPVGFHPRGAIRFAAFVKAEHRHVVEDLTKYVEGMIACLSKTK